MNHVPAWLLWALAFVAGLPGIGLASLWLLMRYLDRKPRDRRPA
jgi:hypothetical protein